MEQRRGAPARIGITLLNILVPGLGLLRLGKWRLAAAIYAVAVGFLLFIYLAPPVGFAAFAGVVLAGLATYPISMVATWHNSSIIEQPVPWCSRWYALVVVTLAAFAISYTLTDEQQVRYRSFYTPAEGMAPTLPKGDRLFAYMRAPKDLRRGDILLVRAPDGSIYVKRLAALPGDTISLTNGAVVINGKSVRQHYVSSELFEDFDGPISASRMREQFPGEDRSHQVYDLGRTIGDDVGPYRVRPGHVFLLGDNRDRSADSRFWHQEMGLEQLPITEIIGWPMFHSFGSSHPIGDAINRKDMK